MISLELYEPLYYFFTAVFTAYGVLFFWGRSSMIIFERSNNLFIFFYILLFTLILGYRPNWVWFGDSVVYAYSFNQYALGSVDFKLDFNNEWIFHALMYYCSRIMDYRGFFLVVEIFYIYPVLWACRRFVPNHYLLMFVFCMGAFSFYSYAYNGIRNGMACSLIIAAFACVNKSLLNKIIAGIFCFIAFNIHRSTALPILCMVASFFVKDSRYIMGWWLFSIILSLVAGGPVEAFFTGLGFDDRMEGYSSKNIVAAAFSSTGFRWDFLLYSAMPIVLGYYVVFIRKIWDKNYLMLLNTYILCNSFWVMMIRASYSNRFVYLSWFMYALVLAYPCLKLPIWKNQGTNTALIFIGHLGFTLFMYWFM